MQSNSQMDCLKFRKIITMSHAPKKKCFQKFFTCILPKKCNNAAFYHGVIAFGE